MIDFRYHIVSLISVFLALAVGIILGAGPLEETIGNSLTGQVDSLRSEKDALRQELDSAQSDLAEVDDYVAAAAPAILDEALTGRRVAVVQMGPVEEDLYTAVETQLAAAGATVSARAQLTEVWTDAEQADARQSYAASLEEYVPDAASTDGFDAVVAQSLILSLTSADPTNTDAFSTNASLVREILVKGKLIEMQGDVTAPADVVLFLAPTDPAADPEATTVKERSAASVIELKLVSAAQAASEATIVAGTEPLEGDLIWTIRSDSALAATTSTVVGVDTISGQVNVPLALAAAEADEIGQFGPGEDSTAPIPPIVSLDPVDRQPAAGDGQPTDDTGADGTDAGAEG